MLDCVLHNFYIKYIHSGMGTVKLNDSVIMWALSIYMRFTYSSIKHTVQLYIHLFICMNCQSNKDL
jgi:hypothetical protein